MQPDAALARLWAWLLLASNALVIAGALMAVLEARAGALVMVGGLALRALGNIALSVVKYGRTMKRPWPEVRPIALDDDE